LVLRPEPGACATAAAARALGYPTTVAPLFRVRPLPPDPAVLAGPFDALLLTSANAVRMLPPRPAGLVPAAGRPPSFPRLDQGRGDGEGTAADWLAPLRSLPVYAVGQATAAAARAAGFAAVVAGEGDAAAIMARAAAAGCRRLLHLAGREHRAVAMAGIGVERAIVYAADAVDALPPAAARAVADGAVALLHSPRAAALFGALVDAAGLSRAVVAVAALSPAVAAAAGPGWAAVAAAARPTDAALLAVVAKLCERPQGEA
jgi:uroporphyrinogen-III synthase